MTRHSHHIIFLILFSIQHCLRELLLAGFIIVVLLSSSAYANAATFDQRPLAGGTVEVLIKGEIYAGDAMRAAEYMDAIQAQSIRVESISLNSPGGIIYEGYLLARLFQMAQVDTVVRKNSVCFSACVIAFIAGKEKFAYYKSKIGVHSAADIDGNESAIATILMVRLTTALGAPPAVVGRMARTPPNKIEILPRRELEEMGVQILEDRVAAPASKCQDPICEALDQIFQ